MVRLDKIEYGGWKNCLELGNDEVRLVITTDVGPRVIFYGFKGGKNIFANFPETLGKNAGNEWTSYGGHRLWHAPEVSPRTYYPDNAEVPYSFDGRTLTLDCPAETSNEMKKVIAITLAETGSHVDVDQKIYNLGEWGKFFACWSLSVMAPGGRAIVPQEKYIPHGAGPGETFSPARNIVVWPFTDMADPRLTWGTKFIRLAEGNVNSKIKFGVTNRCGYAGYALDGDFFLKRRDAYEEGAEYPDMGCSEEYFTMPGMLEIEMLSPLRRVEKGEYNELNESWELFRLALPDDDDGIEKALDSIGVK